ncbi:MAG: alpha/beta fold hydrolase [Actinophytocola sp.]|nr:alpha/beta fold hydrolase [Actinophytocola sp.]
MSQDPVLREWRAEGEDIETRFGTVHVHRQGEGEPGLLLLHGYPTSSYDWRPILPLLTLDFLGFGFSDKPKGHEYRLFEHADVVEEVLAKAGAAGSVDVLAHDMGTSVATELMARDQEKKLSFGLGRVVLCNGSVLLERASLRPIQKLLRSRFGPVVSALSSRPIFTRQLAAVFSDAHPLSREDADRHWELLAAGDGHRQLHKLTAYPHERVEQAPRWHGAVRDWPGTLGLLWGERDPVATVAVLDGLRELRPAAEVITFEELGHFPQTEDPCRFAAALRDLLD